MATYIILHHGKYMNDKQYLVMTIGKEDIAGLGFDTKDITDTDMLNIAKILGDKLLVHGRGSFWEELEGIMIDVYKLEQHEI